MILGVQILGVLDVSGTTSGDAKKSAKLQIFSARAILGLSGTRSGSFYKCAIYKWVHYKWCYL